MNTQLNKPDGSRIAREWHEDQIVYEGVNLGRALTYDILQVVNRLLMTNYVPQTNDATTTIPDTALN